MTSSKARAAARGQRRGFYWQDWYAAWMMLRCWAEPAEGIDAVEAEATGAPHIDDIVVYHRGNTIYKQLKHKAGAENRFTGADLFGEQDGRPSLIARLFIGWTTIKDRVGGTIEIHLTTNAMPSEGSRNRLISPIDFQREILRPARAGVKAFPENQGSIIKALMDLTHATDSVTLIKFLASLRLEFNEPDEDEVRLRVVKLLRNHLRPEASALVEAEAWVARVYELSTRTFEARPLTRSDIDRELRLLFGPAQRLAEHRLALPERHVPRLNLATSIFKAAHDLGTGYLMVLGPPGCGKTTLATWISNEYDDLLLMRYHVFDPTRASMVERKGRASALDFVRTMFDVLADRFPAQAKPYIPTDDTLPDAIVALRQELEQLAGNTKSRIVVVDGIDHVVRSGVERRPLFEALPWPAPENVVFVLFGQPEWDYPSWLRRAPQVAIPPFTSDETCLLVSAWMGWDLDDPGTAAVADTLYEKARGNPLSLFYNLSVVEKLGRTQEEVAASLVNAALFGSTPHEEYSRLLDDLENLLPKPRDSRSLGRDLLTCIAVSTVAVTEERLCAAFEDDDLTPRQARDYLAGLGPVVVERGRGEYWLFHDDFRRYAEERTHPGERPSAHRRLACALERDWQREELSGWVEHLWLACEYKHLANLPQERLLKQWFHLAPREAVVKLHMFALAAAFKLGEEIYILRNALACERAAEVADLPPLSRDDPERLKDWTFAVPPRGVDFASMQRRASALNAAAYECEKEPDLAGEIASRFVLPDDLILSTNEDDEFDFRSYIGGLGRWLLRSGDLAGLKRLYGFERFSETIESVIGEEFCAETKSDVLTAWADAFAGLDDSLDRELAASALLHLAEGRVRCASSIARSLLWCTANSPESSRDATVLLSIIDGINYTNAAQSDALVRMDSRNTSRPENWREFFFHGFVFTASGPVRELSLCEFPSRFTRRMFAAPGTASSVPVANLLWRCGCAAGLASRGQDLITPHELESVLSALLGRELPELESFERFIVTGFCRLYLPLLTLAVRHREPLAKRVRAVVVPAAKEHFYPPDEKTYGLLEATWFVDPETWRAIARDALGVTRLPGTEATDRAGWFNYWIARGSERNIILEDEFLGRSFVATLGVSRKTDPARLAVNILEQNTAGTINKPEGVRRLVDLLIRLVAEPEGGRAAYRHLPRVLALAFQLDPSLFWEEYLRSTVQYGVAEPFGTILADTAVLYLESQEWDSVDDLIALWQCLASRPSGFSNHDNNAVAAGLIIQQRLAELGAPEESERVELWLAALAAPRSTASLEAEDLDSRARRAEGTSAPEEHGGDAESNLDFSVSVERSAPSISNVTIRWFAPWWSSSEHAILREFLDKGGNESWRLVCDRIADQIATASDFYASESGFVADSILDLRPCLPAEEAFEIAIEHLAEKVNFQEPPLPRTESDADKSRREVLVGLTALGLDTNDAETLRRSVRSVAALARNTGTAREVEREMLSRLESGDFRAQIHALIILRQVASLTEEARERICLFTQHEDAWCRWLACSIMKIDPTWPELRKLTFTPAPISSDVWPARSMLSDHYYADETSVREILLRKLGDLVALQEDELRSWLELEARSLEPAKQRSIGWLHRQPGPTLTSTRISEAAGRLACRLASVTSPPVLPALLSSVARQDPWVAVAEPIVAAPEGWTEVCHSYSGGTENREEYLLRSIGIVHANLLDDADWSPELIARAGYRLLKPEMPVEFAWVAEPWPIMAPPAMERGPVVPLSFLNSPFIELSRTRFTLVPRWDLPQFHEVRFEVVDIPRWVHPTFGPVIAGTYGEHFVEERGGEHPRMAWSTGWYASPEWIKSFIPPNTVLIRFWCLTWRERSWGQSEGDATMEFGLQKDIL